VIIYLLRQIMKNSLSYSITELITTVKSFIVHAPGFNQVRNFGVFFKLNYFSQMVLKIFVQNCSERQWKHSILEQYGINYSNGVFYSRVDENGVIGGGLLSFVLKNFADTLYLLNGPFLIKRGWKIPLRHKRNKARACIIKPITAVISFMIQAPSILLL